MKIIINNQEHSQDYSGSTLGEITDQILKNKVFHGTFISKLVLDGREIQPDSEETRQLPVDSVKTLELDISNLQDLVIRNLTNAESYLVKLIPGIQKASELFRMGSEQEANHFFINIVDGIDWFSQVVDSVIHALKQDPETMVYKEKSVMDRKTQLLELTTQMLEANKNKDWVLLGDLLEYEALPFYQDWQSILPEMKKQLKNSTN